MSPQSDEEKREWGISGVAIPGGVLLGLGIGFLIDDIVAGVLIGLGGGFVVMMIGRKSAGSRSKCIQTQCQNGLIAANYGRVYTQLYGF